MNKKADTNISWMVASIIAALIIVVFIVFINIDQIGRAASTASFVSYETRIQGCEEPFTLQKKDIKDYDDDRDGVVDFCDVCVLRSSRDNFDEWINRNYGSFNDRQLEWLRERGIHVKPTYDLFVGLFQNFETNDRDGDRIYDGCDSDVKRKAVDILGRLDVMIENECKRTGRIWDGFITYTPRESRGITQCVATLN